jgi:hypothetical protein
MIKGREYDCKTRERKMERGNGKTAQSERRGKGRIALPKEMV